MNNKPTPRYFLVFYIGHSTFKTYNGYVHFATKGSFLNAKKTTDFILEYNPQLDRVTITGFQELSKDDFNEWKSEE